MRYKRNIEIAPVVKHYGIFRREIGLWEAVALIVSSTIGAGVLGIPYAVARVGIPLGLTYILVLGLLLMGLNLLLASVASATKQDLQLAGLAGKYLGKWGKFLMTLVFYVSMLGAMLIYLIGEGAVLAELFGGSTFVWSLLFFLFGACLIAIGIQTIKRVEMILMMVLVAVVLFIAGSSIPHIDILHLTYTNLAYLFFPYGVILFAFSGLNSIPEAHAILKQKNKTFKQAIIISSAIVIVTYLLFAFVIVGVTGLGTSEVATVGLGTAVGPWMLLFGNIFAALAMGTSFLIVGVSLRDSLAWDYSVPRPLATVAVIALPLLLFLLGLRQFVAALDIVGGVFVSTEMLLAVLIYISAKKRGDLPKGRFGLHNTLWLVVALLFCLSIGAVYSVVKLF